MSYVRFNDSTRTYATHAAALTAVEKFFPGAIDSSEIRIVINTDGTRFSPVFVLSRNTMHFAEPIGRHGFQVLG